MTSSAPRRIGRRGLLASAVAVTVTYATSPRAASSSELDVVAGAPRTFSLPPGRSLVELTIPADVYVSIGIFGPAASLRSVALNGTGPSVRAVRSSAPIAEDGLLPRVLSLAPSAIAAPAQLVVDVVDSVVVEMVASDPTELAAPDAKAMVRGEARARPLVGVPPPTSPEDGWVLQTPSRYAFLRLDMAVALFSAMRATRRRFKGDPIAIGDASQWDGRRPASDRDAPRHISHVGGRDVDLGLPSSDGTQSLLEDRCRGVRLAEDRFGCAPGTVRGLDPRRLAHLLGGVCDAAPGLVTKIYLDEVYRREVIAAAPALVERKWLREEAASALSEDGVLVASPWHTDHVHVRFHGEEGRTLFTR